MVLHNPGCMGDYDFDRIAGYAKKRFVDGYSTIELMAQATSDKEKQEIALVAMMDLEDQTVKDLNLTCVYANECKITNCRSLLKQLIDDLLAPAPQ